MIKAEYYGREGVTSSGNAALIDTIYSYNYVSFRFRLRLSFIELVARRLTRNSSEDEIANVNFLYDDIVHALKTQ